jgi:oxygen-independent coproporphyrinogen-3 oxidase
MPSTIACPTAGPGLPSHSQPLPSSCLDLLLKYDKPVPRYTSYPTAAAFSPEVGEEEMAAQLGRRTCEPLSLYVHVPFCRHACWYCGCNRITTQAGSKVVEPYLRALGKELDIISRLSAQRRRLAQLHWGGGTPNYLNSEELRRLWSVIETHFDLQSDLEASIEVNPEFLDREQVLALRQLGFRRISFGIQDADPEVQQAVNRVVAVDQLRKVMGWMREAEFESVNVDLICGLPLQTPKRFQNTLELVRELLPDRISLFSFAYLPAQLPLQRKIAADDLPSQRERLQMLDNAHLSLGQWGYDAIGMDHYALHNDSLAVAAREGCLHRNFQGYTTGGDLELLGVGPTAISQFPHLYSQNARDMKAYSSAVESGHLPVERGLVVNAPEVLERRELIREVMCHFQLRFDKQRFSLEWDRLRELEADGLVQLREEGGMGVMEVTGRGRWLIRTIAAVFDPAQNQRARGARLI